MKKSFKQLLTIQIFMLLVIITGFFYGNVFKNDLQIIFLFVSFVALYSVFRLDIRNDFKYRQTLKTVMICLLFYFILIYVGGLFTGFAKTIYSFGFTNLIYNIIPTLIYIVLMEFIRSIYINRSNNNKIIIVLSCIIFSLFASSPPVVDTSAAAVTQVWKYIGELIFNMLVLVGTIKMSDRVVREMMGL